jgi:hypothetical protein
MSILSRIYRSTATQSIHDTIFLILLLTFELVISIGIVRYVPYTEIDWKAYIQEVEAWLEGETDYMNIRGDTGPLVYPAGFLYLFAWLRWLTDDGKNIAKAQSIFIGIYWMQQFTILLIYHERIPWIRSRFKEKDELTLAHQVWSWRGAMAITCFSKRIHSIFLLRLFNDGPTMLLLYISVLLFMRQRWNMGCVVFSFAVSMKMNVLLFAPGLLLLLLQASPNLKTVFLRLGLGCALPQLILGAPFLTTYPVSYLRKAFELDRVFFYKWTVNWKVRRRVIRKESCKFILMTLLVSAGGCIFSQVRLPCLALLPSMWIGHLVSSMASRDTTTNFQAVLPTETPLFPLYSIHHVRVELCRYCIRANTALPVLFVVFCCTTILAVVIVEWRIFFNVGAQITSNGRSRSCFFDISSYLLE